MILTMDVGNTNIKTALFDGVEMKKYWRLSTSSTHTSDEYGFLLSGLLERDGIDCSDIEGIVMSSVVPTINFTLEHMCKNYFGQSPMMVAPGIKTGINLKYENPRELGSDRIANAVAVQAEYGGPCIFIDFGTATTFGAIDEEGSFLGGCICPGLKLTSDALVRGTAKLPRFELVRPEHVISRTTVTNLQSGVINGFIGQIEYLVRKFREELHAPEALVVATGGMAVIVAEEGGIIDKEAEKRATSVYLVDRTIPMLPERLCNFICSLRPNEEKLAFSVIFNITEKGEVKDSRIVHTVINSDRRFTYEEAQQIIETKEGDFKEEVLTLDTIAKALREKRFSAGAINFDRYEVKFEIDEKGKPISVYFKESKDANKLVEEFMLLANRTVAEKVGRVPKNKKAKVLPYRIHDRPGKAGKLVAVHRPFRL